MADHKIYGNNGAGNVQALDYDRRQVAHLQAVVDRLNAVIDKHNTDCEDLRAQLAAANARADAAWDALRNIAELNKTARDENGHAWDNSDLIAQEIHFALRDKPAPVEDGWQPIETAPKDGFFLVCAHPPSVSCEFDVSVSVVWNGRGGISLIAHLDADGIEMPYLDGPATHWMPLPAPPEV